VREEPREKARDRVLVVGTTWDYIALVEERMPGRAVFLTDPQERQKAPWKVPPDKDEILQDLTRYDDVVDAVRSHVNQYKIHFTGIACFDCESMALAALLGEAFSLKYPSPAAVAACRSKFESKRRWIAANLPCPQVALAAKDQDALAFMKRIAGPVVLKPLCGSGSELTFACHDSKELLRGMDSVRQGLSSRSGHRMYIAEGKEDPSEVFVLEEWVEGREYSCDFIIQEANVIILRLARKVLSREQSFGTTLAYLIPSEIPHVLDHGRFYDQLACCAHALGMNEALCMVDFIVRDGQACFLELAPRPGGDCIPFLVRECCGLDTIEAMIDFAEGKRIHIPSLEQWKRLAGVRLLADRAGRVARLDDRAIQEDPRVLDCHFRVGQGHEIVLPPQDYDSRVLGYVIMKPNCWEDADSECLEVADKLDVILEQGT